jgi:hypothetical protein
VHIRAQNPLICPTPGLLLRWLVAQNGAELCKFCTKQAKPTKPFSTENPEKA